MRGLMYEQVAAELAALQHEDERMSRSQAQEEKAGAPATPVSYMAKIASLRLEMQVCLCVCVYVCVRVCVFMCVCLMCVCMFANDLACLVGRRCRNLPGCVCGL